MKDSLDPQLTSSDSLQSNDQSSVQISFASIPSLVDYIKEVVSILLEDNRHIHASLLNLLADSSTKGLFSLFIFFLLFKYLHYLNFSNCL